MQPLLANGMVMMLVYPLWGAAVLVAGLLSITALVLAIRRKAPRFVLFALAASFAQFAVPIAYADPISHYGSAHVAPVILLGLSVLPPLIAGLGVYLSRRPGPGGER